MTEWLRALLLALCTTGVVTAGFQYWGDRKHRRTQAVIETATTATTIEAAELSTEAQRLALVERRLQILSNTHDKTVDVMQGQLNRAFARIEKLEQTSRDAFAYIRELRLWGRNVAPTIPLPPVPLTIDINE